MFYKPPTPPPPPPPPHPPPPPPPPKKKRKRKTQEKINVLIVQLSSGDLLASLDEPSRYLFTVNAYLLFRSTQVNTVKSRLMNFQQSHTSKFIKIFKFDV